MDPSTSRSQVCRLYTTSDLYVYLASNGTTDSRRLTQVTANTVSATATGAPSATWMAGGNYLLLTPTSDALGTINIIQSNPGNADWEVDLNGLQLRSR